MEVKKNKKFEYIIIALMLVLIAVGSFLIYKKYSNKKEKEEIDVTEKEKVTPLIYKITHDDSDNVIYLFGSIHVASLGELEFPDYLMDAYNTSDYLAVEMDLVDYMENASTNLDEIIKQQTYQDGSTIKDHVSSDTYDALVKFMKENYSYNEEMDKYNAYFFESLLTSLVLNKSGLDASSGIDIYFLTLAKQDKKEILEVESYEFQEALLTGFPDRYYELSINSIIEDIDGSVQEIKDLYAAWKRGNEEELYELSKTDLDDPELTQEEKEILIDYDKKVLIDRNVNMASKLEEYFKEDKKVFYMVGAAHLVGDDGIASLLKEHGYKVEKMN